MRYNEPFNEGEKNHMTEEDFQATVREAIYTFEKRNAFKYLPKFLREVYDAKDQIEKAKARGEYHARNCSYDLASSRLKIPSSAYRAFYEQAETQIEVMLQRYK
jgi:hypothetical protein